MSDCTLEAAFLATTYRVETDAGAFDLRIGAPDAAFDTWLRRHGATHWAVLTACNPGGVRTDDDNAKRQQSLLQRVIDFGCGYFPACNLADDGNWPPEPGILVLQLKEAEVQTLASEFSQAAFVAGEVGGAPYLVWAGCVT